MALFAPPGPMEVGDFPGRPRDVVCDWVLRARDK